MLKFLHTADLHLGKSFHDYSLIEDQRYLLGNFVEVLSDPSYNALVIAGDVFDRSIPSPEAAALFSSFLGDLKKARPDLTVLIIPGNHDSPRRLAYGRELFSGLGIHIVSDPASAFEPVLIGNGRESCACFLLPFLYPGELRRGAPHSGGCAPADPAGGAEPVGAVNPAATDADNAVKPAEMTGSAETGVSVEADLPARTQAALAAEASVRLEAARRKSLAGGADYTLLLAHLFCRGGRKSDSERTFLGTAEEIDVSLFSGFDYLALGHLHRKQRPAPNAWYPGSPLAYSFDEAGEEKHFLSVELEKSWGPQSFRAASADPSADPVFRCTATALKPLRPLLKLRGPFAYFLKAQEPELKEAEKCFLEISLTGTGIIENPLPLLQRRFPWLLSVKQTEAFSALSREDGPDSVSFGGRSSVVEDFREFLIDINGAAEEEKILTFKEILEDTDKVETPLS
ncbi:MAG: exonuclease subunit SbcD [Treponema sp.]|jgi:exonuclease SbcD|nr:exonuclease subunit SbcD [Treponema sp.]